jgi:hypothetical protein
MRHIPAIIKPSYLDCRTVSHKRNILMCNNCFYIWVFLNEHHPIYSDTVRSTDQFEIYTSQPEQFFSRISIINYCTWKNFACRIQNFYQNVMYFRIQARILNRWNVSISFIYVQVSSFNVKLKYNIEMNLRECVSGYTDKYQPWDVGCKKGSLFITVIFTNISNNWNFASPFLIF